MDSNEILDQHERKWAEVVAADADAKARGALVGRFVAEPIADGKAIYRVVRVTQRTARIRVVTGIGDDWQIPYWGAEASIPLAYARQNIETRDRVAALFVERLKTGGAI